MCVNLTIYHEPNFSSLASVYAGNLHTSRRTSDQHNWTCEKCSSKSWWHHLYVLSTFHESPRLSATCLGQFRWWKANLQQEKKFHFTLGHLGGIFVTCFFQLLNPLKNIHDHLKLIDSVKPKASFHKLGCVTLGGQRLTDEASQQQRHWAWPWVRANNKHKKLL